MSYPYLIRVLGWDRSGAGVRGQRAAADAETAELLEEVGDFDAELAQLVSGDALRLWSKGWRSNGRG